LVLLSSLLLSERRPRQKLKPEAEAEEDGEYPVGDASRRPARPHTHALSLLSRIPPPPPLLLPLRSAAFWLRSSDPLPTARYSRPRFLANHTRFNRPSVPSSKVRCGRSFSCPHGQTREQKQ